MKHPILLLLLCIPILLSSCRRSPELQYEGHHWKFTKPQGWKLDGTDFDTDLVSTITVQKQGYTSSGVKVFNSFDREFVDDPLDTLLQEFASTLSETLVHRRTIEFSETFDETYGSYPARSATYEFRLLGMEHEGQMWFFEACGRVYQVMQQGAIVDRKHNDRGFELIRSSFSCE